MDICSKPDFYVSIHAPIKGATVHGSYPLFWLCVSIHAPIKGATGFCPKLLGS